MTNKEAMQILEEMPIASNVHFGEIAEAIEIAIKALRNERPHGKWVHREDMNYLDENKVTHIHFMCEKCGFIHDFIDGHTSQYNFCPNCGEEMEADNEMSI